MDSRNSRRPCFVVEDDGLASLADVEAGFSGNNRHHNHNQQHNNYAFFSRPLPYASSSMRNLSSSSSSSFCTSPRSGPRFYDARYEDPQPHFLDACAICKKPLGNRDIFMYSDLAFCGEDCRQERMEMDDAKEMKMSFSSSMKALRKKEQQRKSTSPNKNQDYPCRTSTVAAA